MKRTIIHKYELGSSEVLQAIRNKADMPNGKTKYSCDNIHGHGRIRLAIIESDCTINSLNEDDIKEAIQSYLEAFDISCELEDIKINIADTSEDKPFVYDCDCIVEIEVKTD